MNHHGEIRLGNLSRALAALVLGVGLLTAPRIAAAAGSDSCAGAVAVNSLPFSDTTNNTTFSNSTSNVNASNDPTSCIGLRYRSFWYKFTAPEDGVYAVNTTGSNYDTVVSVYHATTSSCGALGGSQMVGCNDDNPSGLESTAAFHAVEGEQYLVMVASYGTGGGANTQVNFVFGHETVLAPAKPITVKIPLGSASVTKTVKVKVSNPTPDGAVGHGVEMAVYDYSCGFLNLTTPDLDSATGGIQNPISLPGGKTVSANFNFTVAAADVNTAPGIPTRCFLYLTTEEAGTDVNQIDQYNDAAPLVVDIIDLNDTAAPVGDHETIVLPMKPVTLKIPRGATSVTKTLKLKVKNPSPDGAIGHNVEIAVDDNSGCNLTISPADFDKQTPGVQNPIAIAGGKKATALFNVTVNAADIVTGGTKIPTRCSLAIYADSSTDPDQHDFANDYTEVAIDVVDLND